MQPWNNENMLKNIRNSNNYQSSNEQLGNNYGWSNEEEPEDEKDINFIGQDDEDGFNSNEEGEYDQSFDDSDFQNKDPGMILLLQLV